MRGPTVEPNYLVGAYGCRARVGRIRRDPSWVTLARARHRVARAA